MLTQAPEDNVVLMRRRAEISGDALLKSAAGEIERLRATISRLRAHVEHVGHTRACAYIRWLDKDFDGEDDEKPCDCGYDALMADMGESK